MSYTTFTTVFRIPSGLRSVATDERYEVDSYVLVPGTCYYGTVIACKPTPKQYGEVELAQLTGDRGSYVANMLACSGHTPNDTTGPDGTYAEQRVTVVFVASKQQVFFYDVYVADATGSVDGKPEAFVHVTNKDGGLLFGIQSIHIRKITYSYNSTLIIEVT